MSYSISVYLVYAFFCGRIQMVQGGCTHTDVKVGLKGGGGVPIQTLS